MSPKELLHKIYWIAGFAVLFFVLLTARFHLESRSHYASGQSALEEGDPQLAIAYFDQSIRSYSLLNGPGKKSAEQIEKLALQYESSGEMKKAVDAWQTVLSAISAIDTGLSGSRYQKINELKEKVARMRKELAEQKHTS